MGRRLLYQRSMKRLLSSVGLVLVACVLAGCPSKDSPSTSHATSPSGVAAESGTGPLANLESSLAVDETWTAEEGGAPVPFLFYGKQNVRVSAQCRGATGQLACDAIRQIRNAVPVEIARRSLTGNVSAGTRVCTKLGHTLWSAHNAAGAEDGFCKFPDGSMVATGTLEQYGMRVLE